MNLTDELVDSCLADVQYRIMLDAFIFPENLTRPDMIYRYVEDWMGNGHLGDGWTVDEMLDAMLGRLRTHRKVAYAPKFPVVDN